MIIVVGYKKGHLITREAIECRGKSSATEAAYLAALSCDGERALPVIVELAYQEYNQERDCFLGCLTASIALAYTEWDRDEWCSVERINSAIAERCAALQEAASTLAREW